MAASFFTPALLLTAAVGSQREPLTPANVNERLREQVRVARALDWNATPYYAVGVRPLADLLRSDAAGACMPSDKDVRKHGSARARAHTPQPFHLDEGPWLEMAAVHDCLDAQLARTQPSADGAGARASFDDILPPNKAAYLSDLLLLRALRSHPQRVLDPSAAALHFTGLTPHASLVANYSCAERTGETHEQRMRRAASALRAKAERASRAGEQGVIVLMHPSWNWRALGADVRELLRERAHQGRFVLATGDRTYAAHFSSALRDSAVIVPYTASSRLDELARRERDEPYAAGARPISCYFVGNMHRQRGEGKVRFRAVEGFARGAPGGKYVDRVFRRQNVHGLSFRQMAVECAEDMRAARFCLAPAGDVPTSRRLPDAMAAGCVPVHIGRFEQMRFNLPFPHHLDWGSLALFAGSVECLERTNTSAALGALLEAIDPQLLARPSARARAAYAETLSFARARAAPEALLRELAARYRRDLI